MPEDGSSVWVVGSPISSGSGGAFAKSLLESVLRARVRARVRGRVGLKARTPCSTSISVITFNSWCDGSVNERWSERV